MTEVECPNCGAKIAVESEPKKPKQEAANNAQKKTRPRRLQAAQSEPATVKPAAVKPSWWNVDI